jgi:protein-disulfide isomerase
MHYALFVRQDSLGLRPFRQYAADAVVPDLDAFDACVTTPGPVAAIEADSAMARVAGGAGTPTILLNGWRLSGAPDSARLHRYITVLLAGGALDTVTIR